MYQIDVTCSDLNLTTSAADYISVCVPVTKHTRNKDWYTAAGSLVQKEIISYNQRGDVETVEAIFPREDLGVATETYLTPCSVGEDGSWGGSSAAVNDLVRKLRTTLTSSGTDYYADYLFPVYSETVKEGKYVKQTRHICEFEDSLSNKLTGVLAHYYVTERLGMDMVQVDLLITNASLDDDNDFGNNYYATTAPTSYSEYCVKRYFTTIEASITGSLNNGDWLIKQPYLRASDLEITPTFTQGTAPAVSGNYIVDPPSGSPSHGATGVNLLPCKSGAYRRFFYYRNTGDNEKNADAYRSWNHIADGYGENSYRHIPAYGSVPKLVGRAEGTNKTTLDSYIDTLVTNLTTGLEEGRALSGAETPGQCLTERAMGLFHPGLPNDPDSGMPGGAWISLTTGYHNTPKRTVYNDILFSTRSERNWEFQLSSTGLPIEKECWIGLETEVILSPGLEVNLLYWSDMAEGMVYQAAHSNKYSVSANTTDSLCYYEWTYSFTPLMNFQTIGVSHFTRIWGNAEELVWYTNDSLVKDIMRNLGEFHRTPKALEKPGYYFSSTGSYNIHSLYEFDKNWNLPAVSGGGAGEGFVRRIDQSDQFNTNLGREDWWHMNVLAGYYAITPDATKRAALDEHINKYAEMYINVGDNAIGLIDRSAGSGVTLASTEAVDAASGSSYDATYAEFYGEFSSTIKDPYYVSSFDVVKVFDQGLVLCAMRAFNNRFVVDKVSRRKLKEILHRAVKTFYVNSTLPWWGFIARHVPAPEAEMGSWGDLEPAGQALDSSIMSGQLIGTGRREDQYSSYILSCLWQLFGRRVYLDRLYEIRKTTAEDYVDDSVSTSLQTTEPFLQVCSEMIAHHLNDFASVPTRKRG